jgi:hypothetical protein
MASQVSNARFGLERRSERKGEEGGQRRDRVEVAAGSGECVCVWGGGYKRSDRRIVTS